MKFFSALYIFLFLCTSIGICQSSNGEKKDKKKARKFASEVFNDLDVIALTMEPDQETLYVTVGLKDGGGFYKSEKQNKKWGSLEKIEFSSGEYNDNDLFPSPDGSGNYFFMTKRPLKGDSLEKEQNIWVVERNGDEWGSKYPITAVNSEVRDGFPSVTMNGDLFFFSSRDGGYGSADVYKSEKVEGQYQKPKNVGPIVNSEHWDGLPYVAPNGKVMIFFSDRRGGYGNGDLYVSYFDNGSWTEPGNLGPNVNSNMTEVTPFIGPEKKHLYFARVEDIGGAHRRSIYYIDIKNTPIDRHFLD